MADDPSTLRDPHEDELSMLVWNQWAVADRVASQVGWIIARLFNDSLARATASVQAATNLSASWSSNAVGRWWKVTLARESKTGVNLGFIECILAPSQEDDLAIVCAAKMSRTPPLWSALADAQEEARAWMDEQGWGLEYVRTDLGRNDLVRRTVRKADAVAKVKDEGGQGGTLAVSKGLMALQELLNEAVGAYLKLFGHWDSLCEERDAKERGSSASPPIA